MMTKDEPGETAYPPAPWTLAGGAVGVLRLVDSELAARCVPPGLKIVSVWPGKTLGGFLLATYGAGSTLEYHELIVFCGLVRQGVRLGAWISHIYVDHPASVAGGREIWGLPKELATFQEGEEAVISQGGSVILRYAGRAGRLKLPLPLWLPAWGKQGDRLLRSSARGRAWAGLGYAEWAVPPEAPIAELVPSGLGFCIALKGLRITVPPPSAGA